MWKFWERNRLRGQVTNKAAKTGKDKENDTKSLTHKEKQTNWSFETKPLDSRTYGLAESKTQIPRVEDRCTIQHEDTQIFSKKMRVKTSVETKEVEVRRGGDADTKKGSVDIDRRKNLDSSADCHTGVQIQSILMQYFNNIGRRFQEIKIWIVWIFIFLVVWLVRELKLHLLCYDYTLKNKPCNSFLSIIPVIAFSLK